MPTASASESATTPPPPRSPAAGDQTRALLRQAALELLREGIRPKVMTVRSRAGGRGSASTIADVLNELWVEVGGWAATELAGEAPLWPRSVPPALINAANRLWEVALTEAAARHQKNLAEAQQHVRDANDRVRATDQARAETEMRCDALRRENRRLEDFCEQLKRQVEDQILQRRRLETKNERLTEQLRALLTRKGSATGQRTRVRSRKTAKPKATKRSKTPRRKSPSRARIGRAQARKRAGKKRR